MQCVYLGFLFEHCNLSFDLAFTSHRDTRYCNSVTLARLQMVSPDGSVDRAIEAARVNDDSTTKMSRIHSGAA